MASIDELLAALHRAAKTNHRDEFDRHEADLLARFGGFQGMPREVYDRYLEVDRAWPASLTPTKEDPSSHVPRLPLHVRVPDDVFAWLQELGAETGRNRPDVLTACLESIRDDPQLRKSVIEALRAATPDGDDS